MFTGIISDIGEVAARDGGRFEIRCGYAAESIAIGASIACDGACLTATKVDPSGAGSTFAVDVSNETLAKTTLDEWRPGRRINLERALKAGDELGGHIVAGHVDGVGRIVEMHADGQSRRFTVEVPPELAPYIASKGSITLDGISLTVNDVQETSFGINIIPAYLDPHDPGGQKAGRQGQPRSRCLCALCGAPDGVPAVNTNLQRVAYAEGKGFLSPIDEILEDLRNGRMIILVDAEDRENEGDLVVPAQMATPDVINFMAKHGRGLICLSLTRQRADQLRLEYMARQNEARARTAFTVSIEAREGVATGISAHDRARTISTAIDPTKDFNDIVSPGHVFPLIAREGGVLVRAGHTEASVDLARLAGLYPAGVICEIMNDDGTMARMPDLVAFAQRHALKIGTIEDLIGYRLSHDRIVKPIAKTAVESGFGGPFDLHVYETTVEPVEHLALVKGDIKAPGPVLVRVHAVNAMADLLGIGGEGAKGSLIEKSMRAIAQEGRGVIVLIRDLRPKSVSAVIQQAAERKRPGKADAERRQVEIGIGSQILRDLGVSDMVLLSNAPPSRYVGLEAFGLRIVGQRKIG